MTRPWRLTRRKRVEMEAALSRLREDVIGGAHRGPCAATGDGWRLLCGVSIIPYDYRMTEGEREAEDRIQALRVAIALRAALRADEDARCEEAYRRAGPGVAAREAIDALREWPRVDPWVVVRTVPCVVRAQRERVPLALWEVER